MAEVKVANSMIKDYLKANPNTIYVDVFEKMMTAQGSPMPDIFVEDRLHMNAKGYHILGRFDSANFALSTFFLPTL